MAITLVLSVCLMFCHFVAPLLSLFMHQVLTPHQNLLCVFVFVSELVVFLLVCCIAMQLLRGIALSLLAGLLLAPILYRSFV